MHHFWWKIISFEKDLHFFILVISIFLKGNLDFVVWLTANIQKINTYSTEWRSNQEYSKVNLNNRKSIPEPQFAIT